MPAGHPRASRAEARLPPERAAPQDGSHSMAADLVRFAILACRVRDRISTLRALYGAGPLEIDFQDFGEKAAAIRMTRSELTHVAAERVSRSTGQRHSVGGFTGFAEDEADLAEFLPYLETARYT